MKHAVWGFVGLGGFVGISLVAVAAAAFLDGALLRSRALEIFTMDAVQRRDVSVRFRPVSD